ncbi:MAG: hypothetical protein ACF788_12050, partial [Novipirellula sp. JB048]
MPTASASPWEAEPEPWDFSPYKVLVWVVASDPDVDAKRIGEPLQRFLDRDFAALWRMDVADAPPAVANAARRNLDAMTFESITAADPVVAVKRDHPDAVRLRVAANVGEIIDDVYATPGRIEEVQRRAAEVGNESIEGIKAKLRRVDGDAMAVSQRWEDPAT